MSCSLCWMDGGGVYRGCRVTAPCSQLINCRQRTRRKSHTRRDELVTLISLVPRHKAPDLCLQAQRKGRHRRRLALIPGQLGDGWRPEGQAGQVLARYLQPTVPWALACRWRLSVALVDAAERQALSPPPWPPGKLVPLSLISPKRPPRC